MPMQNRKMPEFFVDRDGGHSSAWWGETARMVRRGWIKFCRKRGIDPGRWDREFNCRRERDSND
jgi:hypothetical protein